MANIIFDLKNVQELVKSGEMSVNSVFPWKQYDEISVIQFAIINSDDEFIDFLLANNISLSKTTKSLGMALDVAIKKQKLDVVKKLVTSGAEINPTPHLCKTLFPLHLAIDYGNYDITEFLVMSGAEVNAKVHKATFNSACYNFSALNLAISKMDIRVIKLLLDNNAIIDQASDEVHSSLHLAARLNRVDIIQILEEFGVKFEVIKDQEYTLEFDAAIRHDNMDIVNFFFKNCDNFLDISDSYGDTVAHLAVQFSCINILRYLLDCGTNINIINYDNSSLLDIAMEININHTLRNQIEDQSLEIIKVIEDHII
ncbi:putative ankyrin repeat protein RF_0381 [Cotesia glomerata]|uniref:putative ankyrin repeat protein RF_0381 n=1 Tax=Cotesia glomerata TaxID=32391 RepID=UPI001D021380|nr:putative ankyrin repeat protein RF_0381 [Cotesia glomerata]